MRLTVIALLIAIPLIGCNENATPDQSLQKDDASGDLSSRDVWVVTADGDFQNGEQLIEMEHGTTEGTCEPWAADTYGLQISIGQRKMFLLWDSSPHNPFGLEKGDKFRFANSIENRFFDEYQNGYHARKEDVELVGQVE